MRSKSNPRPSGNMQGQVRTIQDSTLGSQMSLNDHAPQQQNLAQRNAKFYNQQQFQTADRNIKNSNYEMVQQFHNGKQQQLKQQSKQIKLRNNSSGQNINDFQMQSSNPGKQNLDEIQMIIAQQAAQVGMPDNRQNGLQESSGPSPDKIKKIQSSTARKHSSLRRNQPNPNQTQVQNIKMDKLARNQNDARAHQQWMNQTLPIKVEGGGSGGSGSQEQIQDNQNFLQTQLVEGSNFKPQAQTSKKGNQQNNQIYFQNNQYANIKNRIPMDQMRGNGTYTRQEAPHLNQQMILQQHQITNASSDLHIPTLPKNQSKNGKDSQNNSLFSTVQNVLGPNGSKQKIANHPRAATNIGQNTSEMMMQINNSITHQSKKAQSIMNGNSNSILHQKNSQGQMDQPNLSKFRQDSNQFLDANGNLMTPAAIIQQQNQILAQQIQGHQRNNMANQTIQIQGGKGSRQSSKLRKNVQVLRNGAQSGMQTQMPTQLQGQVKNGQRVSQQRRFNNTTLDNYQHQLNTHQTISGAPSGIQSNNNMLLQNQARTLVPAQQNQGQSRSVIRQTQQQNQQKQYLNNFLPANKYVGTKNESNQMRINSQMIVAKNDAPQRAQSTLKPTPGNMQQKNHLVSGQTTKNLSNAQFNNYLIQQQQQQLNETMIGGQSPMLKQNLAMIHKRSESVINQRPPESSHMQQQKIGGRNISIGAQQNQNLYQKFNAKVIQNAGQQIQQQLPSMDSTEQTTTFNESNKMIHQQVNNQNPSAGQMRRNQPHNFSNVSEKSSIMGDYGGTHTTHNSNQTKKSRQGQMMVMQNMSEQQQFFSNRKQGSANKTIALVKNMGSAEQQQHQEIINDIHHNQFPNALNTKPSSHNKNRNNQQNQQYQTQVNMPELKGQTQKRGVSRQNGGLGSAGSNSGNINHPNNKRIMVNQMNINKGQVQMNNQLQQPNKQLQMIHQNQPQLKNVLKNAQNNVNLAQQKMTTVQSKLAGHNQNMIQTQNQQMLIQQQMRNRQLREEGTQENYTEDEEFQNEGDEVIDSIQNTNSHIDASSPTVDNELTSKVLATNPSNQKTQLTLEDQMKLRQQLNANVLTELETVGPAHPGDINNSKKQTPAMTIGLQDHIVIQNKNVYLQNDQMATARDKVQDLKHLSNMDDLNVIIQPPEKTKEGEKGTKNKSNDNLTSAIKIVDRKAESNKVINYETFESSSEDEFSQGAFESAAQSFINKEKALEAKQNISGLQEHKRIERQRRKERKATEKRKQKAEVDRQKRKGIRRKYRLQSQGVEHYDEYQEDMLIFKDSDRESVISYFEGELTSKLEPFTFNKQIDNIHPIAHGNLIDTPTRLVNHSNEFLPQRRKISPDKLDKKGKNKKIDQVKKFTDIEQFSNISKSQQSTARKLEEKKRDMLFQIVSQNDIEQLQVDIQKQIQAKNVHESLNETRIGQKNLKAVRDNNPTSHSVKKTNTNKRY